MDPRSEQPGSPVVTPERQSKLSSFAMTEFEDLFDDVDAAFESLKLSSHDETAQRRAGRAVLGALFEVREQLRLGLGGVYWMAVENDLRGKIGEGVIVIRGRMTHGALNDIRPSFKLALPGPKFFPSAYAYPGMNLTWLELDDMQPIDRSELERRDDHQRYASCIAGQMVLPTLNVAREFFRDLSRSTP